MLIQVDVQAGIDGDFRLMLHVGQHISQAMNPMIVDQSHNTDHFAVALNDLFLDQMVSDQVANRLGSVLIPRAGDAHVERGEEILLQ